MTAPMPIQIVFRPAFALDHAAVPRSDASFAKAEAAVARWTALLELPELVRNLDFEDWHENACQLIAAVDTGLPVFVMGRGYEECHQVVRAFNTDAALPAAGVPTIVIGCLLKSEPFIDGYARERAPDWMRDLDVRWPETARVRAARNYWENPAFHANAGRRCALAAIPDGDTIPSSDPSAMVPVVQHLAREGGRDLMVKIVAESKYAGLERIAVVDPEDAASIQAQLFNAFDYALVHLEGRQAGLLVQDRVQFAHEYRTIVIDGRPVAGAGCVEALCPPYGSGAVFHTATEAVRGDGVILRDVAQIFQLEAAAKRIAEEVAAANPLMTDCTLDLGVLPDGRVAVIETNPLLNYGLYCIDYRLVLQAIVAMVRARAAAHAATAHTAA